jgi:uncharacterized protein (TIGR00730 family)
MQARPNYLTITFSLLKSVVQMLKGMVLISTAPNPIVTIFGGGRLGQESPYAQQAYQLAQRLIAHDISIITGGGPGIMQAASCGAFNSTKRNGERAAKSIAISVKGIDELKKEFLECADIRIEVDEFYARKWLMFQPAIAFAVFPGGFGTLDEIGDVVTLFQTKRMVGKPIILIGESFWRPFIFWLRDEALTKKLIAPEDIESLRVTDDLDQVFKWLYDHCEMCMAKDKAY